MRDRLSKARQSWNMSRIRGKDTAPEKVVRSILHRMATSPTRRAHHHKAM